MVDGFGPEILQVRDVHDASDERAALAVKSDAHDALARSGIATSDVDFRPAAKLPRSALRFLAPFTKRVLAFDVCNDAPNFCFGFVGVIAHSFTRR
jgi:hypothetical protein